MGQPTQPSSPDQKPPTPTPPTAPSPSSSSAALPEKNPKTQTSQIFVSYSRSDRLAIDRLVADLRKQNYTLWMDVDERGIEPGDDWRKTLVEQMSRAEAVIACVSPDFLTSPFCKAEIAQAKAENKPIYPIIMRRLNPDQSLADMQLDHLQFIDLTQDYEGGLRRLNIVLPRPRFPAQQVAQRAGVVIGVIALLIVLLGGVALAAFRGTYVPPTPAPPTATPHFAANEVGVIVSYFVLSDNTTPSDSTAANALIEGFSNTLKSELTNIQNANNDAQSFVLSVVGPQGIDPVVGADSLTRLSNAGVLASNRDASVVVYGLISRSSVTNQFEVQPEFYVAPGKHFTDAQDIVGGYAMGKNIRVDPANSIASQTTVASRIKALAYIIEGLSQHVLRNYDKALSAYSAAMAVPNWTDQDGRNVLYALIGNTHMRLAEKAASACKRDTVLQEVATALEQFKTSQTLNPKYVRAYSGLASTAFFSALWSPKENDACASRLVDVKFLRTALDYLDQAKQADPATDAATIKNLLFNEAQIRFTIWLRKDSTRTADQDTALYNDFVKTTDQVLAKYDRRDGISVAWPVMESYVLRGVGKQTLAASRPEEYRAAIEEYENALAIYNDSNFKDLFSPARAMAIYGAEGDCYLALADYSNADKYYKLALAVAKALENQSAIDAYNARLKTLDARRLGTSTPTVAPTLAPTLAATSQPTTESTTAPVTTPTPTGDTF